MKPARSGPSTMIHELEKTINDQQEVIKNVESKDRRQSCVLALGDWSQLFWFLMSYTAL